MFQIFQTKCSFTLLTVKPATTNSTLQAHFVDLFLRRFLLDENALSIPDTFKIVNCSFHSVVNFRHMC